MYWIYLLPNNTILFMQPAAIPQWLESFLRNTFLEKCHAHDIKKNDLNRYCITCSSSLCKFCVTSAGHEDHDVLTIYKHVYQAAVPLEEMSRHLRCNEIEVFLLCKHPFDKLSLTMLKNKYLIGDCETWRLRNEFKVNRFT